jgi:thiamine pyrophosphate-dependent acetolactate synthase large subunit-like protein
MTKTKSPAKGLDRRTVVRNLLAGRDELLVITGLGSPSYDAMAAGDRPRTYYLWGAMGGAAMMGMGLALAQPHKSVVVITGDGEALMGVGALASIGAQKLKNLTVIVLDNGHYGETGMQPSHTGLGVDLAGIARASGFKSAEVIDTMAGVDALGARLANPSGPAFANVHIAVEEAPRVLPPRDGVQLKNRFRAALGFDTI